MKTVKQLISAAILSMLASTVSAQTVETTPNLITNTWTGTTPYTGTGGNTTSANGNVTGYNSANNTIYFGYMQGTASQIIGINQALSGTGIQVNGYNWAWDINNNNYDNRQGSTDTLTATINTINSSNQTVHSFSQTYNTKFDWTRFSGTQTYSSPYLATDLNSLNVSFSGMDSGYWAGYYGPQVRNVSIGLNYTVDQCTVNPQSSPTCPGYKTYYQMWDDGFARVDLPFAFPFYGQLYTTSYMYTNGVVGFLNNNWGFCCDGTDLNGQISQPNSPWNYAIYALNTDLIPGPNSEFYTQKTDGGTGLKYSWVNVPEIGTNLNNTFHVQIKDSGYIGISYDQVNLNPWRNPLIGIAGDISQGQYSQHYFGPASGLPNLAGTTLTYTGTETTNICLTNPLANPQCPGYAEAYLQQQCSINPLYNSSCPGYAQAYFTQQCSANPLYDVNCPGYASAYYNYQCSANPLYHTGCPGYDQAYFNQQCTANPLYDSQCTGYQQAYFDQQCGLNGLYSTQCPNYADAYYVQQCTANPLYDSGCTGYQQAYFDQQCSLNSLYNNQCPGYAQAYFNQQCSINTLYNESCPGYAQAYFDQQCSINSLYNQSCPGYAQAYFNQQCTLDPLYNNQCTGYQEAYAKKNILNMGSSTTPSASAPVTQETIVVATTSESVSTPAVVADPVVNQVVTTTATSASPAQAATATVPLVPAPQTATTATTVAAVVQEKKEEKKEETKTASTESSSTTTTASSTSSSSKDQPKTTRQALAERRLEAARAKAVEEGKQLANKMGEAATMEAQAQVQGVVVAAMSFVPGFDAYGKTNLPDVPGYKPFEIYKGQRNIDNPAGRRFLTGADRLHQEMVDQQYVR